MNSPHLTEDQCVSLLNQGDSRALSYLMDTYYRALCLFAEKIVGNPHAAEDIAEESIIKLWERNTQFASFLAVKKYLYTCAKNAAFNEIKLGGRRENRHKEYTSIQEPAEDFVLNEIVRSEFMAEIFLAIEHLPEKMGRVFKLSYLQGLSNGEIAEKLGLSMSTVKNQKGRALELLRLQFNDKPHLLALFLLLMAVAEKNPTVH